MSQDIWRGQGCKVTRMKNGHITIGVKVHPQDGGRPYWGSSWGSECPAELAAFLEAAVAAQKAGKW